MVNINGELVQIDDGGYADIFLHKPSGLVVKKLKRELLLDKGICSRFKREYIIMKSLQDVQGIIKVFSFYEDEHAYTMEKAESTLRSYVLNGILGSDLKIELIRQVLSIMATVHSRDIIHRDISPTNIFLISGKVKIADFGLGKDLHALTSYRTFLTNQAGQYVYCAPEQYIQLHEGDKRSDVFSLGRVINFVMTNNPLSPHHDFRGLADKATNDNPMYRYADAEELFQEFEKMVERYKHSDFIKNAEEKISHRIYDDDVENFIYSLSEEKISAYIKNRTRGFADALIRFMRKNNSQAEYIIECIDNSYTEVCQQWEDYDPFSSFAERIIQGQFPFHVKEKAAVILNYIATSVNRFDAQRKIEYLKQAGIDPILEDILDS